MFANNNDNNDVRPILYYDDINPHSRAVLMILNMLDVDIELRAVEMIKGEHLKSTYAKINPARTVPTMVHKDLVITDNAIFSYVCENHDNEKAKQLIAFKCYKRHCRVLSRLFFESQVLHRIHGQLMTDLVRKTIFETDVDYHQKKVEHAYDVMEIYLKDGPYMAGSVLTAADISFVACLGALDMMFPIDVDRTRWEKLNDWFRRMRSLSVQKINTNGIEKQRRLVEYYAKFQFASGVRRFTARVRESLIPRFSLSYACCSIGVQTTRSQETELIDELSAVDTSHKIVVVEKSDGDLEDRITRQTPINEMSQQILSTDVAAQGLATETDSTTPLQAPAMLTTPLHVQLLDDNLMPQPMVIATAQVAVSNLSGRSYGGAHKERPPVPPKRRRNMTIAIPLLAVSTQNSDNKRVVEESVQQPTVAELSKFVEKKPLKYSTENETNKDDCCCVTTLITKISTPHIPTILSRLDGGVEPVVLPKMPPRNEFLIPPVRVFPPKSVTNSTGASKDRMTSLASKLTTAINSPKTSSETLKKNKPTKIPELPPGLPINSPQVALQYSRRPQALAAPPPTPENSSQDEQNDFEFPPPPSEVLIQNPRARGKATQAAKLADTNKVSTECVAKILSKKISGVQTATDNSKVIGESVARAIGKKSNDLKPLTGRKNSALDPKVCKSSRKTKTGLLLASGTKSPCSNISQASLAKDKPRKIQTTLPEANTMQRLIEAATIKNPQDKKTRKLEKSSGVKIVESAGSNVNACKKVSRRSLISNGPAELNSKATEKRRRAEGGGQWRSKEKTLQLAVDTQMKLLKAVFNQSTGVESKATAVAAEKCNTTDVASAKVAQQSTPTTEKTNPKIPTKPIKKEVKPTNPKLSAKTKLKLYPTKVSGRNQIKTTKIFDTSPFIPSVGSNKTQCKVEAEKRSTTKSKKKRGPKAASAEVLNAPKALPLETPCASVPELKCAAAGSTMEQSTSTDITKKGNVTSETTLAKGQQQSSPVDTENRTLKNEIQTTNISTTTIVSPTSNLEQTISPAIRDVPVTTGLVAKALQILSAAKPNLCQVTTNIPKTLPPQPPPLPPSPVVFHLELPPPPPPPTPLNLPRNDALPQAGTVAKALQSLGAVTSEAKLLCGTTKPFKKAVLNVRNTEDRPTPTVVKNTDQHENMTRIAEGTVDARPLAEILTATVQHMNKTKVEHAIGTGLTNETEQSVAKTKNLSDQTEGNMTQATGEETIATNLEQITDTVLLDRKITAFLALNELNNAAEEAVSNSKELTNLNTSEEEPICDTQQQLISAPLLPQIAVAPTEALGSLIKAEPIEVVTPPEEATISFIPETHETDKSYPSFVACTDDTNLFESVDKTPRAAESTIKTTELNRIQRALISEGIVVLEPTTLPAQPNIIITGYTRTEPNTVDPLFAGTGRALGNTIAHTLRGHSVGPCSHGPSANVVISTFGYTPMSDLDSTPEQLLPIKPKHIAPPPPPPPPLSPPLLLNSVTTATANKSAQQCQTEVPVRALCPRMRDNRPYPTAHRSRSERAGERKTIHRGRVM